MFPIGPSEWIMHSWVDERAYLNEGSPAFHEDRCPCFHSNMSQRAGRSLPQFHPDAAEGIARFLMFYIGNEFPEAPRGRVRELAIKVFRELRRRCRLRLISSYVRATDADIQRLGDTERKTRLRVLEAYLARQRDLNIQTERHANLISALQEVIARYAAQAGVRVSHGGVSERERELQEIVDFLTDDEDSDDCE